ncbi:CaiB/BaiF CoA transferase family protein [Maritalea sp.]|uniref:CaiB/BaiF CoA transferase family protein n=1 Tax=Maritalea sp. TaxID=2003361 RepID=UPI0039E477C5
MNKAILDGIRVLDLSRVMSGPFCTSMLADLGAEIIKVELPEIGDDARHFGPYLEGQSTYFMMLNRNKKSITIDMKSEEGRQLIREMIAHCDVLVENFRPGVMQRLGLDYQTVKSIKPDIVYASISGFGQDGPMKDLPAFDLVIQAMSGLMSLTGPKGGPATAVGESIADVSTGMFAAFGIVSALFHRERTGVGQHIDVAMLDSLFSMQLTGLSRQLYFNDTPEPVGNRHPVTYPVDSFPTQTGDVVMVCFSQGAFRSLCELMGNVGLADDPKYSTNDARNANEDELRQLIANWTVQYAQDDLVEKLIAARIPAAPVWTLEQLAKSEHVAHRNSVVQGQYETFGSIPLAPQPVKFSAVADQSAVFVPTLGQHSDQVLSELIGKSAKDIELLRQKNII